MTGRYDRISLNLPKYRPRYKAIEGKTGDIFQGRKGRYQILSIGKDTINVEYIDGEWKGQKITMAKTTHDTMQRNIPIQSKILADRKLELWWYKFPSLYQDEWYENIESKELLDKLELKYPTQAELITNLLETTSIGE